MDIKVRTDGISKSMFSLHLAQVNTAGLLQGECRVFGTVDTAWWANLTHKSTLQTFLDRFACMIHRRREKPCTLSSLSFAWAVFRLRRSHRRECLPAFPQAYIDWPKLILLCAMTTSSVFFQLKDGSSRHPSLNSDFHFLFTWRERLVLSSHLKNKFLK